MTAYSVGTYSRLSREDLKNDRKDASVSIENQTAMLQQYAEEKGWKIYKAYIDDDITGTTFDRPGFQEMLEDINDGRINCVITKDLSRFGRNYTEAALHREQFDRQGVRYIAIHDNHDSLHYKETREFNITTPIKDLVNEMYASDVSRKVRHTKKLLASQGKFCNSRAPYGYQKSKENKHVLVIDEDVYQNVIRVFASYNSGMSARSIADEFNREEIITPNAYHYRTINKPDPYTGNKNVWGSASIMNIIKNPVYYGAMVNGKREVVSYKDKRRLLKSESEWIIIENTHEPIVSKEVWEEAQRINSKRKRTNIKRNADGEVAVFAGLIKCADCGGSMIYNQKVLKSYTKKFFRCSTYTQKGRDVCSMHCIDYDTIYQAVSADIQKHAILATEDEKELIDNIINENETFESKTWCVTGEISENQITAYMR